MASCDYGRLCSHSTKPAGFAAVERFVPVPSRYDQMHELVLRRLLARHGELMDTSALSALLKFGNTRSFRRAAGQGHLPFRVFHIDGRRGWFARTADVAAWLAKIQSQHH